MVWRQAGFLANLPTHATRASRSPRFRPCSLKYAKITPVLQANVCTFCRTEKESLFHLFWSCSETSCIWQGFMKWLAENQIKLKSEIFTLDIIIGLRSDTLSNTKQYFYFLVARYYIWFCRIKEVLPKIERFPSFLSSLMPF